MGAGAIPGAGRRIRSGHADAALTLHRHTVRSARLGSATALAEGVLTIDGDGLVAGLIARDARIKSATIHVALPGDATRVLCTKDVLQPRAKLDGEIGKGTSCVLDGVAVVTCGPIVGFQEGIIDMSGPGAPYTPFSGLTLVVVDLEVVAGTGPHEHEAAVRSAGLWLAEQLAVSAGDVDPDRIEQVVWDALPEDSDLPRIACVGMVLTQGLLHDTYVLGEYASDVLPRTLDPRIIVDGGIVSGNCVSACDKITTFHHATNPVVEELLAGHGERWNFVGVVVTNEPTRLAEKESAARGAIEQVRMLGAAGVVITKEGFGNPDADLMMIVHGLEAAGIRTVAITDEFAGGDGGSQSLADTTPEADALVSVGNANERIVLPPMETLIGPLPDVARLAGGYAQSLREDGSMEVELQAIVGATNQLGYGRLSCRTI